MKTSFINNKLVTALALSTLLSTFCPPASADPKPGTIENPMGSGDGGGGRVVRCGHDGGVKLFAWDYLQTMTVDLNNKFDTDLPELLVEKKVTIEPQSLTSGGFIADAAKPRLITRQRTAKEILDIIALHLRTKIPRLGQDLVDFTNEVFDPSYISEKFEWINGALPLTPVQDLAGLRDIPAFCVTAETVQAVVWSDLSYYPNGTDKMASFSRYEADTEVLKTLSNPLQLSMTLIHEWLRYYETDGLVIQRVNRFLHQLSSRHPIDFKNHLSALGFESSGRFPYFNERYDACLSEAQLRKDNLQGIYLCVRLSDDIRKTTKRKK